MTTLTAIPAIEATILATFATTVYPTEGVFLFRTSKGTVCGCAVGAYMASRGVTYEVFHDRPEQGVGALDRQIARLTGLTVVEAVALSEGYEGTALTLDIMGLTDAEIAAEQTMAQAFFALGQRVRAAVSDRLDIEEEDVP